MINNEGSAVYFLLSTPSSPSSFPSPHHLLEPLAPLLPRPGGVANKTQEWSWSQTYPFTGPFGKETGPKFVRNPAMETNGSVTALADGGV